MTSRLKAHFDGRVIIPDEPVDMPVNQPMTVQVTLGDELPANSMAMDAAFDRLLARAVSNANISAESIQRESLYEDR